MRNLNILEFTVQQQAAKKKKPLRGNRKFDKKFCKGKKNGQYANVENCATFISCANGNAFLMDCPDDLFYMPSMNQCAAEPDANCKQ